MPLELTREVVTQALNDTLLQHWVYYVLLLAFSVVSMLVTVGLSSYIKSRAKNFATQADFNKLLEQMRLTTAATEEIKANIGRADWTEREWRTLRRQKLEELISSAFEIRDWLERRRSELYTLENDRSPSPIWKVLVIGRLYFPELFSLADALDSICISYQALISGTHAQMLMCSDDRLLQLNYLRTREIEIIEMSGKVHAQCLALSQKASSIVDVTFDRGAEHRNPLDA